MTANKIEKKTDLVKQWQYRLNEKNKAKYLNALNRFCEYLEKSPDEVIAEYLNSDLPEDFGLQINAFKLFFEFLERMLPK